MKNVVFVVEGKEDRNFLTQVIQFKISVGKDSKFEFIVLDGDITSLHLFKQRFYQKSGYDFYFLLDCDNHDFEERKLNIITTAENNLIAIKELFLFPDNQSKGNLETLLEKMIPDENKKLISCLDDFISCADNSGVNGLKTDYRKEIYMMYHGSFENSGLASGAKRMYDNSAIWNLNSPALNPLIQFLSTVLK